MKNPAWRILFVVGLLAALVVLAVISAEAQCSMCRAALNGSNNSRFIRNFNVGVLVLLIPPVSIFCTIFLVLRRHRGDGLDSETGESGENRS